MKGTHIWLLLPAAYGLVKANAKWQSQSDDDMFANSELVWLDIKVLLCVDRKDLFTSLSTQRNLIDRSIRGDFSSIRFEFYTGTVEETLLVPDNKNLSDPLTKRDSQLTDPPISS